MDIEIRPVSTKGDLKRFVSFPYSLYARNAYWIPQLRFAEMQTFRRDKNPAFDFCDVEYWLALKNGNVVGRIVGIVNKTYLEIWGEKIARFGYIEFIDDHRVSEALLGTVEDWARTKGMESIHGPLGFTDLDPEGMLVEGFEELGTMESSYNLHYYPLHMERLGYGKDVDWVQHQITVPNDIHGKLKRLAEVVASKYGFRVLQTRGMKDILPYAKEIFYLFNESYKGLYGVVPLTERQIDMYIDQYLKLVHHEYISIVLDREGRLAAFGVTIPSLAKALRKSWGRLFPLGFLYILRALRKNDTADLCLIAVRPELRGRGVNALLLHHFNKVFLKHHIVKAEINPQLESNGRVLAQWKFFETRQHKRRRCYIKQI